MSRLNYKSIAHALADKFINIQIKKQTIKDLMGKESSVNLDFPKVIAILNEELSEDGLKLVAYRGYYMLEDAPYPKEVNTDTNAAVDATSQIKTKVIEPLEDKSLDKSLKIADVFEVLKQSPGKIELFNEIIEPLGKRIEVSGLRLVLT
jgi:hypothetical protein